MDCHLSISNDIVSSKMYDKRDDFEFEIVNYPFLDSVMFLVLHHIEDMFFNSSDLLDHLAMKLKGLQKLNITHVYVCLL